MGLAALSLAIAVNARCEVCRRSFDNSFDNDTHRNEIDRLERQVRMRYELPIFTPFGDFPDWAKRSAEGQRINTLIMCMESFVLRNQGAQTAAAADANADANQPAAAN